MKAFGITDEDGWDDLEKDFPKFVREKLLTMDLAAYRYEPPPRGG
jgi:hypothetical protein